ncbi:MAG: Uma2 family endonuclease [Microcystis aeruginosa G13-10]|nr:Uma2 family endonuclease [Microcystis aeruginosa G13-10]
MSLSLITRKFTVEEYEKMTTQGIIKPDEKVELIRGEIIKMSPMGTRHAACIDRLIQLLYQKLGQKIILRGQNPIRLNNNSQPEPDLSLLIPRSDFYVAAYPCPQKEECLEVYRHPLHGSYQAIHEYSINERVFITSFPDIEFTIAEILGV